jgi:Bacterial SH3 domain
MKAHRRFLPSIVLAVVWTLVAHADPATTIRAVELKQAPASDAETVATLEEEATVQTGERRGGWIRVKTDAGASGWVKFLALRFSGTGRGKNSDSGVAQLFNPARSGSSGSQVTTGVRGLDAEDISAAQPNPTALERMDGYAVNADEASRFAAAGPLQPQSVDYPVEQ